MPAVKPSSMGENEALVAINTLPEWAQSAFQGYKYDLFHVYGVQLTLRVWVCTRRSCHWEAACLLVVLACPC